MFDANKRPCPRSTLKKTRKNKSKLNKNEVIIRLFSLPSDGNNQRDRLPIFVFSLPGWSLLLYTKYVIKPAYMFAI